MGIDFGGIRRRLQWRLHRLRLRAVDAKIELLRRGFDMLNKEDRISVAELEAHYQERIAEWEDRDKKALFTSVGLALSLWAQMEESLVVIAGMLLRKIYENRSNHVLDNKL
jgi:hypothetical protein